MTMLKETFRFALRTRWKLALFIFVLGVALAALARSMEVNPFVTDIQQWMEANAPDPGTSPEEMLFGRTMMLLALGAVLRRAFLLGAAFFGLQVVGRLVAGERASGAIMLWAQHPGSLPGFYGRRYVAMQGANAAVQAVFALTVATAALGAGGGVVMRAFVEPFVIGLLTAALSFGLSALGIRRNAFMGLTYVFVSPVVASLFVGDLAPLTTGAWAPVAAVAPYVFFPSGAIEDFAQGFSTGWDWSAAGLVLSHFALWSGLAWLGLRKVARRPLKL